MLLITGHQRSGTGYMAQLCKAMGMDVGHERPGRDGISSFQYAVDTERVCFHSADLHRGRKHYHFDRIIHVVRNPLDAIASTAFTDMNGAIEWQANFVRVSLGDPPLHQAIQTYVGWNLLCEEQADDRVRAEDALTELPALLDKTVTGNPPPTNYNGREHRSLTWAKLQMASSHDEFTALWEMADRYGYK